MITLDVPLGERSYPIYIGTNLLGRPDLVAPFVTGAQVLIVSNETVAPLYLDRAKAAFRDFEPCTLALPDGERFKTLATLNLVFDTLLANRFGRDCTLVALGGGVVGDIVGFAAASYQRGVNFIQIPTTLLAQVDSSVGGKTGVNHALGKNMIGAFHQPSCVVADIDTFATLPDRELSAGLAEVIKYGLIADPSFFSWLEECLPELLERRVGELTYAVRQSCENKVKVVAADERERGRRAILNLGHTFGHAIESGLGYGRWLHGEAVAAGMVQAADLSTRLGWLRRVELDRIRALLARAKLPTRGPAELAPARLLELMSVDKKVQNKQLRLALLKAIGECVITDRFDSNALAQTLDGCRAPAP